MELGLLRENLKQVNLDLANLHKIEIITLQLGPTPCDPLDRSQ